MEPCALRVRHALLEYVYVQLGKRTVVVFAKIYRTTTIIVERVLMFAQQVNHVLRGNVSVRQTARIKRVGMMGVVEVVVVVMKVHTLSAIIPLESVLHVLLLGINRKKDVVGAMKLYVM